MTITKTAPSAAEIVSFRLRPGTSREQFLAALAPTYDRLALYPGHRSRRLTEAPDGSFTEYLEWATMADALAAAEAFGTDPVMAPLAEMIDPESITMRHEPILMAKG